MNTPNFANQFDSVVDSNLEWLMDNGESVFDTTNAFLKGVYEGVQWCLAYPPYLAAGVACFGRERLWRS